MSARVLQASAASLLALALLIPPIAARGEVYMGIKPPMHLKDVKALFPKATVTRMEPAWIKEEDALYTIGGVGISGTIVVKFNDRRPWAAKLLREGPSTPLDSLYRSWLSDSMLAASATSEEDDALYVVWVRWLPDSPVPLTRLIAKYGQPEASGFSDEDFEPYRAWTSRGIVAYLEDDLKHVGRIDFNFVPDDYLTGTPKKGTSRSRK